MKTLSKTTFIIAGAFAALPLWADTEIRIMAANITSGNDQSYDPGHGQRIMQGLQPDIVLVQEFNYSNNSSTAIDSFVSSTFGSDFYWSRESGAQIPNGVISRWPIIESGEWTDSHVSNRDYAWAKIDIPGDKDLWAISVHLLTRSSGVRNDEAAELVNYIQQHVPNDDYIVVGGDFNTSSFSESAFGTFRQVLTVEQPYPADQNGRTGTNASRSKPYDHVLVSANLDGQEIPVTIGSNSFPNGLVFDSRVYTPLSDVSPVQASDSGSSNMQHMAVIRDFTIAEGSDEPEQPTNDPVELQSGQEVSNSVPRNEWRYYYIDVPSGASNLEVTTTGTGDIDLYVREGALPDAENFDYRPWLAGSSETVTVDSSSEPQALTAGRWYIGVSGYSYSDYTVKAVVQGGNGGSVNPEPTPEPGSPELIDEQAKSSFVAKSEWQYYYIDVPAGTGNLNITTSGDGDADLYVRFGEEPTKSTYDQRPFLDGSNENVSIDNPQAGRYWVGINGYSGSNYTVVADYTATGSEPSLPANASTPVNESNVTVLQGKWKNWTVDVPADATKVVIEMTGDGDADLYVRYGDDYPTLNTWDYRPYQSSSTETVTISGNTLKAGQWWVSANGYASSSTVNVKVTIYQ